MYQFNITSSSVVGTTLNLYENLKSYVDLPTNNFILLKFRGLNTNYQRTVIAKPSNADYTNPTYTINNRYSLIQVVVFNSNTSGAANVDASSYRLTSQIVLPSPEMYEIKYYYRSDYSLRVASSIVALTEIPELTSLLNVTREADAPNLQAPYSYYTEYNTNDLVSTDISTYGLPLEADDKRDAEYGVQTWTPNYSS